MVNGRTFDRSAPQQFLTWLCHRYGVRTYLHYIRGQLSADTYRESRQVHARLVKMIRARKRAIYVDTIISPSMRSAVAQARQLPGPSGTDNNCLLTEFAIDDGVEIIGEIEEAVSMATAVRINSLVLRHGNHFFGERRDIHIWLTWHYYRNANLMILLAYILLGHPDWKDGHVRIFAAFPKADVEAERKRLHDMFTTGRLPISKKNLVVIPTDEESDFAELVQKRSSTADLVLLGLTEEPLREKGGELLKRHPFAPAVRTNPPTNVAA